MLAASADIVLMSDESVAQRLPLDDAAALAAAARRGDRAAFAALHERFAPMVHGIAVARVPRSEAADIVQEVFLQAMRNIATLRDENAVGSWLVSMTRKLIAQHYRRHRDALAIRRPDDVAVDVPPGPPATVSPDRRFASSLEDGNEEAERVLRVIQSLPDAYAQTLALRLVEGMTGPQIAACTGMTPASVRVNLHRGMAMLRERLGLERER